MVNLKKSKKGGKQAEKHNAILILSRYLILLTLMFSTPLIYKIFLPLTVYSSANILRAFYEVAINNNIIIINFLILIEIIPACVAASAYLLLLLLNLSVPMNARKRIYSILISFLLFFILNILRIVFLSMLLVNNFAFFDLTHKLFWYFLSTLFVILIWFFIVKIFSIKEIPIYSDLRLLIKR